MKSTHTKVKDIIHENTNVPQMYLSSGLFTNKMTSLLFNLRCQCVNEFKQNFAAPNVLYMCPLCSYFEDTQEHALHCNTLTKYLPTHLQDLLSEVKYSDIFGSINDQL